MMPQAFYVECTEASYFLAWKPMEVWWYCSGSVADFNMVLVNPVVIARAATSVIQLHVEQSGGDHGEIWSRFDCCRRL
jgi:hypothetical protein